MGVTISSEDGRPIKDTNPFYTSTVLTGRKAKNGISDRGNYTSLGAGVRATVLNIVKPIELLSLAFAPASDSKVNLYLTPYKEDGTLSPYNFFLPQNAAGGFPATFRNLQTYPVSGLKVVNDNVPAGVYRLILERPFLFGNGVKIEVENTDIVGHNATVLYGYTEV